MLRKVLIATAAAGLLSACAAETWDIDAVQALPGKGGAFEQALQKEYIQQAQTEKVRGDWDDTAYYVAKARAAADGKTVMPTEVGERMLPAAVVADVTKARAELVKMLDGSGRTKAAAAAAKAQVSGFDCWLENLEEGFRPEAIATCKAVFDSAMKDMQAALAPPAPPPAITAPVIAPPPFVVTFASGSAAIDSSGQAVLAKAAEGYKAEKPVTVVIAGHTDASGNAQANILLSQKRAEAVANGLAKLGVDPKAMALEAYGEEKPAVKTSDGSKDAHNRRVDITLRRGQ